MGKIKRNRVLDIGMRHSNDDSRKKLHVAYIIDRFPSPTEHFILNEITSLERRDIRITILVLRKQKKYLDMPELKKLESPVRYLPRIFLALPFLVYFYYPSLLFCAKKHKQGFKLHSPKSFFKLFRDYCTNLFFFAYLKGKDIDHIHAHFAFVATDIASLLSEKLGVKCSFTMHSRDIYLNSPQRLGELLSKASFAITCTNYNRDYINKLTSQKYGKKIFTVYHGINVLKWGGGEQAKKKVSTDIRILSVARLVEKKGLVYLLEAVKRLTRGGHNIQCTIIGKGPQEKQLKSFIKNNGLREHVHILGFQQRDVVRKYLMEADIFLLPCTVAKDGDRDGLPNTVLEAMAIGVPVVSTNVSAIPEAIRDRKTGMLVNEKDELALAKAVSELLENKGLYRQIAKKSRKEIVERFDHQVSIGQLLAIFKDNI